jgi:hypothetical protein
LYLSIIKNIRSYPLFPGNNYKTIVNKNQKSVRKNREKIEKREKGKKENTGKE